MTKLHKNFDVELQDSRRRLQEHITAIEGLLWRRLTGKLRAAGWYDLDDILASMRRRLDTRLFNGQLSISNEAELNAFIHKVAKNIALEKYRSARRQTRLERIVAKSKCETILLSPSSIGESVPNFKTIELKANRQHRQLLELWLHGLRECEIAARLSIPVETYRKRRMRLFSRLRARP